MADVSTHSSGHSNSHSIHVVIGSDDNHDDSESINRRSSLSHQQGDKEGDASGSNISGKSRRGGGLRMLRRMSLTGMYVCMYVWWT